MTTRLTAPNQPTANLVYDTSLVPIRITRAGDTRITRAGDTRVIRSVILARLLTAPTNRHSMTAPDVVLRDFVNVPLNPDIRITRTGDIRITRAGDTRVTRNSDYLRPIQLTAP